MFGGGWRAKVGGEGAEIGEGQGWCFGALVAHAVGEIDRSSSEVLFSVLFSVAPCARSQYGARHESAARHMNSERPHCRSVMAWLAAPGIWGLGLLALSWLGIFPGVSLAACLADTDGLSAAYVAQLVRSQWAVAWALLVAGLVAGIGRIWTVRLPAQWERWILPSICLAGFAGAWTVQCGLFGNIPHITDATSHWFQARIFAAGRLAVPTPPCTAAFFSITSLSAFTVWAHQVFSRSGSVVNLALATCDDAAGLYTVPCRGASHCGPSFGSGDCPCAATLLAVSPCCCCWPDRSCLI